MFIEAQKVSAELYLRDVVAILVDEYLVHVVNSLHANLDGFGSFADIYEKLLFTVDFSCFHRMAENLLVEAIVTQIFAIDCRGEDVISSRSSTKTVIDFRSDFLPVFELGISSNYLGEIESISVIFPGSHRALNTGAELINDKLNKDSTLTEADPLVIKVSCSVSAIDMNEVMVVTV